MVSLGRALLLSAILFGALGAHSLSAYNDVPVVTVYPDEPATRATFYVSAGGPLERFTSKPDAWYALYRLPLHPGQPWAILLHHEYDQERVRVFALDRSPFDTVSMKHELRMTTIDWQPFQGHKSRTYEAVVALPSDSATPGIYLLVEWTPQGRADRPQPLLFQVLTAGDSYMGRRRHQTRWWMWGGGGSLKNQRPVVLPMPRRKDGGTVF